MKPKNKRRSDAKTDKRNKNVKTLGLFTFLFIFSVFFIGLLLSGVSAIFIRSIFHGFNGFLSRVYELPFLSYLLISSLLSLIFSIIIEYKSRH